MTEDTIHIDGKHTSAHIKTTNVDDTCIEQVQEIVDHEAFQNPIQIMPDAHAGAGAVIGFTMPLGDRIVPNTVGVDIGCGMTAFNMGQSDELAERIEEKPREADEKIRNRVPLGRETFADIDYPQSYHIVDDFPWHDCEWKARSLNNNYNEVEVDENFGEAYFNDLCERVGYDPQRAINSLGSLGGGNHFIEVSQSQQTGNYWVVVHSGSRGIGLSIAEYWQSRAHQNCDGRADEARDALADVPDWAYKFDASDVSDDELLQWLQGGKGEDFKDTDAIRKRLDGEAIGELVNEMKDIAKYVAENADGSELDYLDGDNRAGYLKDMIFAQTYAAQSRHRMAETVAMVFNADIKERIVSTHNYIDFEDLTIRKGATRVHKGERGVIPFNMRDGAVIVRGRGNSEWHRSAPHGAGRRGSRRWAHREFDLAEYTREMSEVFSTSVNENTLDEAPMAYKDTDSILARLTETAEVEEELVPCINIKAEH
jgi:tRNA-splicing ligase RtcB